MVTAIPMSSSKGLTPPPHSAMLIPAKFLVSFALLRRCLRSKISAAIEGKAKSFSRRGAKTAAKQAEKRIKEENFDFIKAHFAECGNFLFFAEQPVFSPTQNPECCPDRQRWPALAGNFYRRRRNASEQRARRNLG